MQLSKETMLETLHTIIKQYQTTFQNAINAVVEEDVSNYPILVAYPSHIQVQIGITIFGEDWNNDWMFRLTTLEELAVKKVIEMNKISEFRQLYKQRNKHFCVFLIEQNKTQWIFIPTEA